MEVQTFLSVHKSDYNRICQEYASIDKYVEEPSHRIDVFCNSCNRHKESPRLTYACWFCGYSQHMDSLIIQDILSDYNISESVLYTIPLVRINSIEHCMHYSDEQLFVISLIKGNNTIHSTDRDNLIKYIIWHNGIIY
jgi:hypothetical protein